MAHALRHLQILASRDTIARMKTIIAIILAALLTACGTSNTSTVQPADAAASAPTAGGKGAGGGGW